MKSWSFPRKVLDVQQFVNNCGSKKILEPCSSWCVLFKVMPSHLQTKSAKKIALGRNCEASGIKYNLTSTLDAISFISSSRIIKHDGEKRFELRSPSIWKCPSCFRRLYLIVSFTKHHCRPCCKADYQITTLKMIPIYPENLNWKV